jgi:hypothetical protein
MTTTFFFCELFEKCEDEFNQFKMSLPNDVPLFRDSTSFQSLLGEIHAFVEFGKERQILLDK